MRLERPSLHAMRKPHSRVAKLLARSVLRLRAMAKRNESWTLPFVVIEWTTIVVGLVMTMAVFMMHC